MPSAPAWIRAARVWLGAVGRAGFARAVPAWFGVAIVGGAVLGGNGLSPRDVGALAATAPRLIAVLAVAWLVLLAPAARAIVDGPERGLLRSLPGARGLEAATIATVMLAVHGPWGALATAATGARGALSWGLVAMVSTVGAMVMTRWRRVPRRPRWHGATGALVGVHARAIVRRRGGGLAFATGLALLAGALGAALVTSADVGAAGSAALGAACGAVAVACGLAAIASAVVEDRRTLAPWLAAAAATATAPVAAAVVLTSAGTTLGAAAGVATVVIGAPHGWAVVAATAATGLGVGLVMTAVAARAATARQPAAAIAGSAGAVAVGSVIAIGMFALVGVALVIGVGAALAVGAPTR